MLVAEGYHCVSGTRHTIRAAPKNVKNALGMANRESLRVRMGQLSRAFNGLGRDLRCLMEKSEMPQSPAQVAQCGRAYLLAVLVLQRSAAVRILEGSRLLEMKSCGSKFAFRQVSGADDAIGNAKRRYVIVALSLCKKFHGCTRLLSDRASDLMGRPSPIEDGQLQ